MKFDVTFNTDTVMGPGSVYLVETGVLVEGDFPRFRLPFLYQVLRQIICSRGMRTIPFSRIVKYTPPSTLRSAHQIVYSLPNRSKATISFTMARKDKRNNAEFSTRFQEYSTVMKQFSRS